MEPTRYQKKLLKLVRNPRRFVLDSKIATAARRSLAVDSDDDKPRGLAVAKQPSALTPRASRLTNQHLMMALAAGCEAFFIDDDSVDCVTLCAQAQERATVMDSVLAVCGSNDLLLALRGDEYFEAPDSVAEVFEATRNDNVIMVRLADQRSVNTHFLEIQLWKDEGNQLSAPKPNAISQRVFKRSLENANIPRRGELTMLNEILGCRIEHVVPFEIDYVFSWVNGNEPAWQRMYQSYKSDSETDSNSLSRFHNRDELRFSLRSLDLYAPWIRQIHIVSNCEAPSWLKTDHPKINWVPHEDVFEAEHLPTFSSHAIESRLHHIPGLAEHFIYSNDDFLLTRPAKKSDFFEPNGLCKLKLEAWGSVNGEVSETEPDYLNAARNCQALMERDFGASPTQLHHHAPQALRIDILKEMEERYSEQFAATSQSRFRAPTDIAVTGFLFHHYAYLTGRAIKSNIKTQLIQQNHNYPVRYRSILEERNLTELDRRHLSICVNDGANSHLNPKWNRLTAEFLAKYFESKSEFER